MRQKVHSSTHNYYKKERKTRDIYIYFPSAVLSLLASILTVSNLEWETHISTNRGLILFFCGLVFFPSLYLGINTIFLHTTPGRKVVRSYKLNYSDVYDISNKQISAVQALFCCLTGATSICYSCKRNPLKTSHYISEAYAWFGAAYFFYDIWSMYKVYAAKVLPTQVKDGVKISKVLSWFWKITAYLQNNAVIVGHHIFIGCFGFLVITHFRGGLGDCFFGFVYLMEASTPFVSLRGILSKIGMKDSPLYVVNGLMMLATFFICRIVMFPYTIYMYSVSIQTDFISAIYTLPRGCLVSISVLMLPQIYWFHLMLRGATKVLRKSSSNNNNLKNIKGK